MPGACLLQDRSVCLVLALFTLPLLADRPRLHSSSLVTGEGGAVGDAPGVAARGRPGVLAPNVSVAPWVYLGCISVAVWVFVRFTRLFLLFER